MTAIEKSGHFATDSVAALFLHNLPISEYDNPFVSLPICAASSL
jgi:hypothetical protein